MRLGISHIYLLKVMMAVTFLLLIGIEANAQYYSTGQEPASIRWKQIKTDHIKLVFPDYYEEDARKLAGYLDTVYGYASASLDYYPKRISLILHTQSSTSNAVVAWAPKRIEFYTTPPQDMYAQPWLQQLSLHEYRHVVQIEKLNQGPTKVISWLFGQQGTAAILGLYVPSWFLEGDAVATETGLSYSGRGRQPLFEMKMRALLLEKGSYSYDKASMGSYRNFIPNQYELGYFLVTEGRRKYGPELWEHSLNRVARRPYMVTPFQKGIKDISGKRKLPFYNESMAGLGRAWEKQDEETKTGEVGQLNADQKLYTDYLHPLSVGDSLVIAIKLPLDELPQFVSIDKEGEEKIIFKPGFLKLETFSYAGEKICWLETRSDLRWANRSSTVIRIYDLQSKKAYTIRKKMRLFAPALSDDASRIVAVQVDSLNQYFLVVLDASDGKLIHKIPTPYNAFPMTPVWAGDKLIIAILVSENGKNIAKFDVASGRSKNLINWDFTDISQPVFQTPYIYFTAGWSGISNIFALNTEEGDIHKVTSSRFGADYVSLSEEGDKLLYSDYTAEGFRIVSQEIIRENWESLNDVYDGSIGLYRTLESQEEVVPSGSEIPASKIPSRRYSKIGNLFNFHSWAPLDINASTYDIHPGVSIMSQNLLSSSFLNAGYSYNVNEQAGKIYGIYTYAGWYPIIDLGVDYGLRRDYADNHDKTDIEEIKWNETNLKAGLRLPLNFRRGKYFMGLQASVYANQGLRRMSPEMFVEFTRPDIFSAGYRISFYRQIKSNFRDIFPKWGQSLALYYRNTPFQGDPNCYIAAAVMKLYFPGIVKHQGLSIYAGYQQRDVGYYNYKFSDIVAYPRGIFGYQDQKLFSVQGTYGFPVAYPDWSIGPVVYMKRIRANLFYDYSYARDGNFTRDYSSVGADLLTEVHLLRFIAPFEFGVRCAYLPEEESFYWGFLFSVGFSSFYMGDGPFGSAQDRLSAMGYRQ